MPKKAHSLCAEGKWTDGYNGGPGAEEWRLSENNLFFKCQGEGIPSQA